MRRARVAGVLAAGSVAAAVLYAERGRPIRRSTISFLRAAEPRLILSGKAAHAYVYGRWVDRYIDTLVNHLFPRFSAGQREWLVARYHGKTLTHEDARTLVTLDSPLYVEDLEQIIPFEKARRLVLDGPPDIAVIDCACRKARENPCEPLDVCMIVGQPFVDFMLEHNDSARRLTTDEAVQLLTEVHARGHIHSAWFKDVMLDRMYAICNCCTCCCGGLEMMSKYGTMMVAPSGYLPQVDAVALHRLRHLRRRLPVRRLDHGRRPPRGGLGSLHGVQRLRGPVSGDGHQHGARRAEGHPAGRTRPRRAGIGCPGHYALTRGRTRRHRAYLL